MFDYIAGGFDLVAGHAIGNKRKYGFIFSFIGNSIWVYVALDAKIYGLLLVVVPALVMNIRNYLKWRRESE